MKKLTVIVVNHNHGEMFKKAVQSLYTLPDVSDFQSVVVNNTPSDGMGDWLMANYPEVKIINNQTSDGFAHNINSAIRYAGPCQYYLLLNPDVICLPGLLDNLLLFMDNFPDVGIAAPQLLNPDGTHQPSARTFPTLQALFIRLFHLDKLFRNSRHLKEYLMIDHKFEKYSEVDWITGAILILRKQALDQVGLMDERFSLYFEDEDLCCRMWRKEWKVCYVPEIKAYHIHLAHGRRRPWSKAGRKHIISGLKMFSKHRWRISRN